MTTAFYRGEWVVLGWDGSVGPLESGDACLGRRVGLAHPGAIARLRSRAEPGGTAVVLAQEA